MLTSMPRAKAFDPDVALDRAVELFWRLGYEGTSMAKLLEFMGISRQSLYDTYGDKHTLFLAVVDRHSSHVQAQFSTIVETGPTPLGSIRAIFDWVEREVVEVPEHRSCLMSNCALELGQRDPAIRERVSEHLSQVEDVFHGQLLRAQELGELAPAANARALARFLTNAIHGLGVLARGGAPSPVVRDSIDTTLSVLVA